ncbi:SseB protein N-terminal domain-containing protein [Methanobrevibacter millerae]|uniref:SseB protein N-terminal domain-containing protein n=2 Tax=Methanobrevibacter millerae TaxID=230361 RepID=A0A1G5WJ20_9EURY|nr:SseB protein N-terminal domain-containing protein [Methanobrevibacter millerae]
MVIIMENTAENLKELTEQYIELEDNQSSEEELHELAHEIDHLVFRSELIMLLNKVDEETEIVALLIGEDEDDESFFLPVYTSEEEAKKAIEFFMNEEGSGEFEMDKATGQDIIAAYEEDDDFLGLAINAPENGFVVFAETIHDCCDE